MQETTGSHIYSTHLNADSGETLSNIISKAYTSNPMNKPKKIAGSIMSMKALRNDLAT